MANSPTAEERKILTSMEAFINESRVTNFSDAVFAFAATLLVLKIDLPMTTDTRYTVSLVNAITGLWPQYFANIISFLIIGFYWLNHHAIFNQLKHLDHKIVWMNTVFLIFLSFLPFPVDLFGDFSTSPPVIAFYSFSIAVVGFALAALWLYATTGRRLISASVSAREVKIYTAELLLAPIVFLLSAPLAYIDPLVSQFSWILVVLGVLILRRKSKIKES